MSGDLRLDIPTPCHEDWALMRPEEKGKFCSSCCKTVIDFSLMSDQEVLAYLAGPVNKVCGRFTADQLQRDLMAPPQQKRKGWMVWHFLLAGLLVASKGRGQVRPLRTASHQVMGAPVRLVTGKVAAVNCADTVVPAPVYKELPPVEVIGYKAMGRISITGGVSAIVDTTFFSDNTKSRVQQLIADSLMLVGLGKKEFSVYPNPASRGTVIKLSLSLNFAGKCTAGLYNTAGMLMQAKTIEVDGGPRVDLLGIPVSLPAGLYIVRLSAPGLKKGYSQKLIVE